MKWFLAALFALAWVGAARAQSATQNNAEVVSNCGSPNSTYTAGSGNYKPETQDTSGNTCVTTGLSTAGGWTPFLANGLSTTVKAVKASAGQLSLVQCYNPNASVAYIQIFNVASGSVTLGTTTPLISVGIPATSSGGAAFSSVGIQFSTAISIAATTTATGLTAPGTALDCNLGYN